MKELDLTRAELSSGVAALSAGLLLVVERTTSATIIFSKKIKKTGRAT
jgi:hypothetical protein